MLHVRRQYRIAIVKTRIGPQTEGGRHAVRRHIHIERQQPVSGGSFIQRARQQRVENQPGKIGRGVALDRERVVFVEGGYPQIAHQPQFTTFRSGWVDVVEMVEVHRVLEVTPQRIAMRCPSWRSDPGQEQKE